MKGKRRQESIGNDLPHMPQAPRQSILLPSKQPTNQPGGSVRISYPAVTSSVRDGTLVGASSKASHNRHGKAVGGTDFYDGQDEDDDDYDDHLRFQKADMENATLVSREVQRLRGMESQKVKRRRRIWAGAADLVLMALTTYVLARYCMAYMHLSPSNVPLSESTQNVSADPLLRTIALLSVALTAYSDLLFLLAAIYLRCSRKRSFGTPVVFVGVLLAVLLQIILSLSNLGIIVAWHSYYTKHPDNIRGATRDVARRCNGQWEFDLVWDAASASPIATPDADGDSAGGTTGCPANLKTFHLFIMAAVVRLFLFVVFAVLFLHLLRRYNKSLGLGLARIIDEHDHRRHSTTASRQVFDSDSIRDADEKATLRASTVKESAEMHQLLAEGGSAFHGSTTIGARKDTLRRGGAADLPGQWNQAIMTQDAQDLERDDATLTGADMPRLSRFRWQRGEPSTHEPGKTYQYHSLAADHVDDNHAAHDHSAEGWGAALYRRFWHGGDATTAETSHRDQHDPHDEADGLLLDHDHWYSPALDAQARAPAARGPHERDPSKLGVSGWFRREASGEDDVHVNVYQHQGHQYVESAAPAAQAPRRPSSSSSTAASPNLRPQHHRTPSQERRAAEARHQASKKAGKTGASNTNMISAAKTPNSQVGDDLPAMPSPATSPATVPLRIRNDSSPSPPSPSDALPLATAHKRQASIPSQQQQQTPSYVRHLGRMVQRMPSILSGDSQTDNGGSRGPSESSQTHNHVGQHQHFHSAHCNGSNLGTHGEVPEIEERNSPLPGAWS